MSDDLRKRALIIDLARSIHAAKKTYTLLWPMLKINMESTKALNEGLANALTIATMLAFDEGTITGEDLRGE